MKSEEPFNTIIPVFGLFTRIILWFLPSRYSIEKDFFGGTHEMEYKKFRGHTYIISFKEL